MKPSGMRRHWAVVAFLILTMGLQSCAPTKLPLNTSVPAMKVRKFPVSAAVVIPETVRNGVSTYDVSCAGNYEIPIGAELEAGIGETLSPIFDTVDVVTDKGLAVGHYDVVVEPKPLQLTTDGHCLSRRFLYLLGPFYIFTNPTDSFDATAEVPVTVMDRQGQTILTDTFKSKTHNKDALFQTAADKDSAVRIVLREAVIDALQQLSRGLANSPQMVSYARTAPKRPADRAQASVVRTERSSDVDILPQVAVKPQKTRFAVIIGIEQYRQNLPPVEFASHDAYIMREYLTKTLGYPDENVVLVVNERAAKSDLEKYIERWLPNRVDKDSSVLIYYSGHGAPNPTTQEGFLVPYDGDPTFLEITGYPLKRLYEQLAKLPAREILVVLDSCFSGSGGRSVIAKGARPLVVSMENPVLTGDRVVVLTASSASQISSTYDQKSHGLFTYFFLKGLQGAADTNKDGTIDLSELYAYVKPEVERVARREYNNDQVPQLIGSPEILKRGVQLLDRGGP
ncbi:exported protein of unknown function [Nitrospira japonica]|uniref:Peptidase C14 caspase domain-containing protein n=1 Tax=Nitrospira japonica TaxID=1325564 RepID=A0A1W1I100_9BACT|nr:caspase family protein [Nitrospira japonica]SLM46523.1 exported protein of unknown function [Nitrospira japonica]